MTTTIRTTTIRTSTARTSTARPAYGTQSGGRSRVHVSRPAVAGSCPGAAPERDCPFCSGPETD